MKHLEFVTEEVTTKDIDDDPQKSTITYATVTDDTVGLEVLQRNGEARVLRKGEVVVPATSNSYDVFAPKEWESMWNDEERVVKQNAPATADAAAATGDKSTSGKSS